jgi:hypothetical protein
VEIGESTKKPCHRGETFCALPFRNENHRESFVKSAADSLENARLGYNKKRAAQAGPFKVSFEFLKRSAFDDDVVKRLR